MRRTGLAMATILGALCLGCPGRAVAQRQNFTFAPDTSAQIEAGGADLPMTHWVERASTVQQNLMVHNRTNTVITVQSYTVTNCHGIQLHQCQAHAVNLAVPAHATVDVAAIRQTRDPGAWSYSYEIEGRTATTSSLTLVMTGRVGS